MANEGYVQVKQRLDEILEAVSDEGKPLDEVLALYEEAVKLGSQVSGLIETDISERIFASDEDVEKPLQAEGEAPAGQEAPAAPAAPGENA